MLETARQQFRRIVLLTVAALACLLMLSLSMAARPQQAARPGGDPAYRASVEKWRQDYEADLKSDHGWLTISGLFWLHEGENTFGSDPLNDIVLPESSSPPEAGAFELRGSAVTAHIKPGVSVMRNGVQVETVELQHDSPSDRLAIGGLTLWVHSSGGRQTIRMQDKNSALRREFTGLHWFPVDESYRVTARYFPNDTPKDVPIQNLAGDSLALSISGFVTFTLRGQELRLEATADQTGALSFVIRDLTSGKETYAASRFLDTAPPKDGIVTLDFNEAYNPPCAYNPNTTCPLPPPGNRLRVRIEAGEKTYHREH
jgi:uncharacterized protein (DUF1684 family)